MDETLKNVRLHPARQFLEHLNKFRDRFVCPCCHNREWGIQVMSIDPDLVDNRDDSTPDLDLVVPRFLTGVSLPGIDMPPPQTMLPTTCQVCGYTALFDANLVNKETNPDE